MEENSNVRKRAIDTFYYTCGSLQYYCTVQFGMQYKLLIYCILTMFFTDQACVKSIIELNDVQTG